MNRTFRNVILILTLCLTPASAFSNLGLHLGADLGLDFYSNLEYATFHPTHYTGTFYLAYSIREDLDLGAEASITKIHLLHASATGGEQHLIPLYEIGPALSYRVWSGPSDRVGLRIRPSLRYVWGYLYDDWESSIGDPCPRVGTCKGFNARFAISAYYGILALSFGYDLSQVKLYDTAVEQTWFGRMGLKSLDLSGPSFSVGVNTGL